MAINWVRYNDKVTTEIRDTKQQQKSTAWRKEKNSHWQGNKVWNPQDGE